jgi:hypothetical protein
MKYCSKNPHYHLVSLKWFAAIVTAFVSVGLSADIYAQTIRGKLMKGPYPIAGIAVNIDSPARGPSGVVYSGADGMYYFFNISPGPYTLQVWDVPNAPPLQFQIYVNPQPWVNIAPIQIR